MRKSLTALALGVLMMAPPLLVPDASAGRSNWVFGAGFWVNGALFKIGYVPRYGHGPDYYFRVKAPIRYRGHRCSDRCYRNRGYGYHHRSCPVVRHHLHRHGFDFGLVFSRYAPDYGHRRGYYRDYDRYERPYYRYERKRRPYRSDRRYGYGGGSCPY